MEKKLETLGLCEICGGVAMPGGNVCPRCWESEGFRETVEIIEAIKNAPPVEDDPDVPF